jgi:hypothetical protein
MSKKRRGAIAALALTAGSAAAAAMIRKRNYKRRPHVGLYFEDGSMVSLPDSSMQATALLDLGSQALQASGRR